MRVAVDARQVYRPRPRGIGKVLTLLYRALAGRRPDWRFTLIHQEDIPVPRLEGLPNVRRSRIDFAGADRFDLWERAVLPAAVLAARADVIHAPANTAPRVAPAPVVVHVHDLIPLETAPDDPRTAEWVRQVTAAAHRARHVLTGSEYSKRRITEALGVPAEKVTVNSWAPDPAARRVDDPVEVDKARTRHGLRPGEPYLFAFGAADPRKNTARLIEAFARLPGHVRGEFRLLIVGVQEGALVGFRELAAGLGVGERVVLRGYTDETELPALLTGSVGLCFPSRCEGFGLPILDAFACRTPVLTGNRTSLPEVAGDAALLVDPDSVEAIRDGMCRLLTDEQLRRGLAARGAERVKLFAWDRVAETVARVFEDAAGHN